MKREIGKGAQGLSILMVLGMTVQRKLRISCALWIYSGAAMYRLNGPLYSIFLCSCVHIIFLVFNPHVIKALMPKSCAGSVSRLSGKTGLPSQTLGCHQDPGSGKRPHCPPPVPKAQVESGSSTSEGRGRKGTEAADGQTEGTGDSRNEIHGKFDYLFLWVLSYIGMKNIHQEIHKAVFVKQPICVFLGTAEGDGESG